MRVQFYEVDVGSWNGGRTHTVCAVSPEQAYRIAVVELLGGKDGGLDEDCVVQIREVKGRKCRCVYDYLNGFDLYQE
jgi:hypothetical protein